MGALKRIAEDRVQGRFIESVLEEEAAKIKAEQSQAVDDYGLFETGKLKSMLQGHFSVANAGDGKRISLAYVSYMRFLDMKRVREKQMGYNIYNRIIFGRIYNKLMGKLMYGYSEAVRNKIAGEIDTEIG